ncbi:hypothetical protein L2E82_30364 [Cichorium intybus]|uniref:Uncharacterized protein n=1 Tax=Cichorium intybus TaxID=13427 RepID=A0ACB9D061_CICIN|nr:hypothetical protein L2E82_30364 [Cichorium intybus]
MNEIATDRQKIFYEVDGQEVMSTLKTKRSKGEISSLWTYGCICQLTYLRIYEGVLKKGDFITSINTRKKIKGKNEYTNIGIDEVSED